MRTPLVAGNWKMNLGTSHEAVEFVRSIRRGLQAVEGVEIVLCPPFTVLGAIADILGGSRVALGAQDMHWDEKGAHTGDVSPVMLAGLCRHVIVGHSERRETRSEAESDAAINRKARAALAHSLIPIVCVGENLAQKEAGQTDEIVGGQVSAAFAGIDPGRVPSCIVAYEPIWAIGTGKAASPADANRTVNLAVRGVLSRLFGEGIAQQVRILYGGSVNAGNIGSFVEMPDIDGALVGGASLTPDFVKLVEAVAGR
jgi:triosephosphate isomerase